MNLPPDPQRSRTSKTPLLALTTGVLAGMILLLLLQANDSSLPAPAAPPEVRPSKPAVPVIDPIDEKALRARAWSAISPRLDEADVAALSGVEKTATEIEAFFIDRKQGSRSLAEVLLSMRGKWKVIKSKIGRISDKLPFAEQDADVAFLNEMFGKHLFTSEEARLAIEGPIKAYTQQIAAIENQLLVRIRADLSDGELHVGELMPELKNDELLRKEYEKLLDEIHGMVKGEVSHDVRREVASFVTGEVAAQIALRVAVAVGTRLGVSAGVLSVGAAASWATFGVGLVAAVVVDFAIDWVERLAGHDPEAAIAARINQTLDEIRVLFVDGDPKARQAYFKIRQLEREATSDEARRAFRDAAASIEKSGNLGIRFELQNLHESRKKLRREALRRLITEGPA